jgi:hypothetical protein
MQIKHGIHEVDKVDFCHGMRDVKVDLALWWPVMYGATGSIGFLTVQALADKFSIPGQ